MAELTTEQKKALALAQARLRLKQQGGDKVAPYGLTGLVTGNKGKSVAGDVATQVGVGSLLGAIDIPGSFGAAGQMTQDAVSGGASLLGAPEWLSSGAGQFARLLGGPAYMLPSSDQMIGAVENEFGQLPQPETTAGKYARSGTRFATSSAVGPGGLGARVLSGGLAGLGSEGLGQAFEGSSLEPAARVIGGIGAGLTPQAARMGWGAVMEAMRPANEKAAKVILQRLQESGMTPDQAMSKLQDMGPEAMLADVSPGMQVTTGGTAVADPGAGQKIAAALSGRREGAPSRVKNMLDQAFGPYKGPQELADEITRARAPAGPAYELAKTHVVDPEEAVAKIEDLMKTFGRNSDVGTTLEGFKNQLVDGKGNIIGRGNIVHGVREQLDDAIETARRAGKGKMAARLTEVRREVDKALKSQIPGFAEADKIWSDTAKIQKAYEYGNEALLGKGVYPDESAKVFSKMAVPEFDAARQGVRAKLAMDFSNPAKNPTVGLERSLLGNMNDQKVPQLLGQDQFNRLAKGLDTESTFLETSALGEPSRGSRTAVLDAAKEMWGSRGAPSLLGDMVAGGTAGAAIGGPGGAAAGAGASFVNSMKQKIAGALKTRAKPAIVNAAADILTASGGNVQAAMELLKTVAADLPRSQQGQAMTAIANALLSIKSSTSTAGYGR